MTGPETSQLTETPAITARGNASYLPDSVFSTPCPPLSHVWARVSPNGGWEEPSLNICFIFHSSPTAAPLVPAWEEEEEPVMIYHFYGRVSDEAGGKISSWEAEPGWQEQLLR